VDFTEFVEVIVLCHHTEFNLSSSSGPFIITIDMESCKVLYYKSLYNYFKSSLNSWLHCPTASVAPLLQMPITVIALFVFHRISLFSNIYHQE
jgi:hypothetical protein